MEKFSILRLNPDGWPDFGEPIFKSVAAAQRHLEYLRQVVPGVYRIIDQAGKIIFTDTSELMGLMFPGVEFASPENSLVKIRRYEK